MVTSGTKLGDATFSVLSVLAPKQTHTKECSFLLLSPQEPNIDRKAMIPSQYFQRDTRPSVFLFHGLSLIDFESREMWPENVVVKQLMDMEILYYNSETRPQTVLLVKSIFA